MLIHLSEIMERGVIDNTVRGIIDLRLWCGEEQEPLHFLIPGNCRQDIAGCRVSFKNRAYAKGLINEWPLLDHISSKTESFKAGDLTLSRRKIESDNRQSISNVLSLEFFADDTIRILIELSQFDFELSLPQWELSFEEENLQGFMSMEAMREYVAHCRQLYRRMTMSTITGEFPRCSWDDILNDAEARAAIHASVREKYQGIDNAPAFEAYVLDLPDVLGELAQQDEASKEPFYYPNRNDLAMMDFIDAPFRKPLKKAMYHTLFQTTSGLTEILQKRFQAIMGNPEFEQDEAEMLMRRYSVIVSNILASILMVQEDESYIEESLSKRLQNIRTRIERLSVDFIKLLPDEKLSLELETSTLLNGLDDFFGECHRS